MARLGVVWFDPGPETGWAVLVVDDFRAHEEPILSRVRHFAAGTFYTYPKGYPQNRYTTAEYDLLINGQIDECLELIRMWPEAAYGCEDFSLATDVRGKEVLAPVRVMQGIDWALHTAGIHLEKQMPSERQDEERVKRWGFQMPNPRGATGARSAHALSATGHALTFLRKAATNGKIAASAWGGARGDWEPHIRVLPREKR